MGSIDCKRCLSKETEKYYEIKLGQQLVNNNNNSEYENLFNSQRILNIIDYNPKEEISIVKSDINNIENTDQNILDENKVVPMAPQDQITEPITKKPIIIQVPPMTQKNAYFERKLIQYLKKALLYHLIIIRCLMILN